MNRTIFLLAMVSLPVWIFAAALVRGQEAEDKKQRVFLRIEQAAANVETIESDFVQEKHMSMMEKVLISKGRLYYQKPDRLCWEVLEPVLSGFVVNGGRGKRWRGEAGRQEAFALDQDPMIEFFVKQIFAWTRADFVWLEKVYHITVVEEKPTVLKLVPISEKEKRFLSHILLHFSNSDSHVERVRINEENEDFTLIRFLNTSINTPIEEDIF